MALDLEDGTGPYSSDVTGCRPRRAVVSVVAVNGGAQSRTWLQVGLLLSGPFQNRVQNLLEVGPTLQSRAQWARLH